MKFHFMLFLQLNLFSYWAYSGLHLQHERKHLQELLENQEFRNTSWHLLVLCLINIYHMIVKNNFHND